MFGFFKKKITPEALNEVREAVLAIFRRERHGEGYSIEEIEAMKKYVKLAESADMWTRFDLPQERLLRKTIALVLIAQNK
jgi:hypothetical protein